MSFFEAACYVFAVTGYQNDQQAAISGQANTNACNSPLLAGMANNNDRLTAIVAGSRIATGGDVTDSKNVQVPIIIYGKFINNDTSPMHYWIECNGYIMETWVDHGFEYVAANANSRNRPPSCVNERSNYAVGQANSSLTVFQAHNIMDNAPDLYGRLALPRLRRLRGG